MRAPAAIDESLRSAAASLERTLAERVVTAVDRRGLTVREAQALTGQAAADFSRLRSGDLDRFTIDRLLTIAEALGDRVTVSLTDGEGTAPDAPAPLRPRLRDLRALFRWYAVRRLDAFGSVTRADFDPRRSDFDFVVDFGRSRTYGPADQYFRFHAALEKLFDRKADLVEFNALADSRLKRSIGRSRIPVYEQVA